MGDKREREGRGEEWKESRRGQGKEEEALTNS